MPGIPSSSVRTTIAATAGLLLLLAGCQTPMPLQTRQPSNLPLASDCATQMGLITPSKFRPAIHVSQGRQLLSIGSQSLTFSTGPNWTDWSEAGVPAATPSFQDTYGGVGIPGAQWMLGVSNVSGSNGGAIYSDNHFTLPSGATNITAEVELSFLCASASFQANNSTGYYITSSNYPQPTAVTTYAIPTGQFQPGDNVFYLYVEGNVNPPVPPDGATIGMTAAVTVNYDLAGASPSPTPTPTLAPFGLNITPTEFSPFDSHAQIDVSAPAGWTLTTDTPEGPATIASGTGSTTFDWSGVVKQGTDQQETLLGGTFNLTLKSTVDGDTESQPVILDGLPGFSFTGDIASELAAPLQVADEDIEEEYPIRDKIGLPLPPPLPADVAPITPTEITVNAGKPYITTVKATDPATGTTVTKEIVTQETVAGRALDKHYARQVNKVPPSIWPKPTGTPTRRGELAEETIISLLSDPDGFTYELNENPVLVKKYGEPLFDFRVNPPSRFAGQGVRYGAKSHRFIGFLDKNE